MSSKKKPSKPAAPQPLVKLTFAKFPGKQIGVYFEKQKLCFYADFGFNQYESPSVPGLKQKIEAAIKAGATPDVTWVPVISVEDEGNMGAPRENKPDVDIVFLVERKYIAITKRGLQEVEWQVPEKMRMLKASDCYCVGSTARHRMLPKLPYLSPEKWRTLTLLPYDEKTWEKLRAICGQLNAARQSLIKAIRSSKFDAVFVPKAAAAAPNKPLTDKPAPKPDPKQPELPLVAAAQKPISVGKLAKPALGNSLPQIRDDVKRGSAPAKKKQANRGDNTAREHLVVKYQGKQLTLGHGPLGNYLVEALRKTYPTIHSAFCLKDNRIQISIQGESVPLTIPGDLFEELINHRPPLAGVLNKEQTSTSALPETPSSGAIAKLHELAAVLGKDDSVEIPSVVLLAAGFPGSAKGTLYGDGEIIVNIPKKSSQFLRMNSLEERILEHAREAKGAEKELVHA